MWRILLIVSVLMLSTSVLTSVRADSSNRKSLADKHAPAGIMGDHLHSKGEWMVEYRYMNMYMDDNLIGDRRVTDPTTIVPTVVNGIPTNGVATPTDMTMEMHMVHMMYGASDDVTLYTMLMLPSLTMDHIRGPGNPSPAPLHSEFTTHNSGFGDIALGALLRLYSDEKYDLLCNLGCSVPDGRSISNDDHPHGRADTVALSHATGQRNIQRSSRNDAQAIRGLVELRMAVSNRFADRAKLSRL